MEIRNQDKVELRAAEGAVPQVVGTGIVQYDGTQGTEAVLMVDERGAPRLRERVLPEAIDAWERSSGLSTLVTNEHDTKQVLGKTSAGTARLERTGRGVGYVSDIPDTQYGRDLIVNLRNGNVSGSSFEFMAAGDGLKFHREGDAVIVSIKRFAKVLQVGPVVEGAYPAADAQLAEGRSAILAGYQKFLEAEEEEANRAKKQKQADMNREATAALLAAELD